MGTPAQYLTSALDICCNSPQLWPSEDGALNCGQVMVVQVLAEDCTLLTLEHTAWAQRTRRLECTFSQQYKKPGHENLAGWR